MLDRQNETNDDYVKKRKQRVLGELDMTPMVDVTFLLLIFFMVTASFALQRSIPMPRQVSDRTSNTLIEPKIDADESIELEIDESGAFLVLSKQWEREPTGKQNLISTFKEAIGDGNSTNKLDIKVHENAKLQMLVDGMDAGTIAGFHTVQITQVSGFR